MRKVKSIFAGLALLISMNMQAQIQLDIKGGILNSSADLRGIDASIVPNAEAKILPSIGLGFGYSFDKHFAIVSGINFQANGFNAAEGTSFELGGIDVPIGVEFRYTERVLEIPLHLKVSYPTKFANFYAKGGASMGIGLGGTYKTVASSFIDIVLTNDDIQYDGRINRNTFSGDAGLGAEFHYGKGKLILESVFQKSFNDKINDSTFDIGVRNKAIGFKVGYALSF